MAILRSLRSCSTSAPSPTICGSGYAPLHILAWIRKPDIGEDEGDTIPEAHWQRDQRTD